MADEKYISINYWDWENNYKPLEEKYYKLQQENVALNNRQMNEALDEILSRYTGTDSLLMIKEEPAKMYYANYYGKHLVGSVCMTDAAKELANILFEERLKKVPKWIKKWFKL